MPERAACISEFYLLYYNPSNVLKLTRMDKGINEVKKRQRERERLRGEADMCKDSNKPKLVDVANCIQNETNLNGNQMSCDGNK